MGCNINYRRCFEFDIDNTYYIVSRNSSRKPFSVLAIDSVT